MARKRMNKDKKAVFPKMTLSFINQYHALLKVGLLHDFFSSGVFNKVRVRPTPSTQEIFERNNMQFRPETNGFMIGYAASEAYSPIKDLKGTMLLSFYLEHDDPNFYNYTDLPFEFDDDTIFYFDNKALEKETTDFNNLSIGQYVTEEDKIDITAPLIQHDFDDPQEDTEIEVVNAAEEVVFEMEVTGGRETAHINLTGQPEGKYTLLIDGLEEYSFYLYTGMKKVFGAIDIIIDKDEIGEYAFFDDEGNVEVQEYNIHFKTRSVRWKYLLIETGDKQMHTDHEVYDSSKSKDHQIVEFEEAQEEELDSGKPIHTVWSETQIPLRERQPEQFKLKTRRGRNGVEWITDLPCASAKEQLKINSLNENEVFSELIVYL